jgi:hypothetical protein
MKLLEILLFRGGGEDIKYQTELANFVSRYAETSRKVSAKDGMNAKVFDIKPSNNYVWRVWEKDPGYERFLDFVQNNPNEHFPKILSKVRVEKVKFAKPVQDTTIKFVKLEKLKPLNVNGISSLSDAIQIIGMSNEELDKDKLLLGSIEDKADYVLSLPIPSTSDIDKDDEDAMESIRDAIIKNEKFFELVFNLMLNHQGNDINPENVMLRGNVPVIIDPFSD